MGDEAAATKGVAPSGSPPPPTRCPPQDDTADLPVELEGPAVFASGHLELLASARLGDQEYNRRHDQALLRALLSTPMASILIASVPSQATRRRTTRCFDLSNVLHSLRLALKRWSGTMKHRAEEALAHKMGTLPKDKSLTKEALAKFKAPCHKTPSPLSPNYSRRTVNSHHSLTTPSSSSASIACFPTNITPSPTPTDPAGPDTLVAWPR